MAIPFSVIMPFYKGDKPEFLNEALESLYSQTLKADELVLIQDGPVSTEHTRLIQAWKEKMPEIQHIEFTVNKGLSAALNAGINAAKYEWLARMDADDICLPHRFEKQVEVIKNNPNLSILSSWIEEFDGEMKIHQGIKKVPENSEDIVAYAKWRCPFNHMTVFFRKSALNQIGLYKSYSKENTNGFGEDYELWARFLVNGYKAYNIQEVLLKARTGVNFFGKRRRGWLYYKNELNVLKDLYQLGLISLSHLIVHAIVKGVIRLSPAILVKTVYKILRKK